MIDITPAIFTLIGINEVCPPTIILLPPASLFEYCTGMRLSPSDTKTTKTITTNKIARITTILTQPIALPEAAVIRLLTPVPKPERILAKMMNDAPLPIPISVNFSPNHIIKIVPETIVNRATI